jgi:phosphoglycolate phosphatase-like HAD superfamily hydrolase
MDHHKKLIELKPRKEFFIGIDSDGCIFDTMEIKHKECFCPNYINYFELQKISKYAREVWEFVNLYSKTRGTNRFKALIRCFELLPQRPEVMARNPEFIDLTLLKKWVDKETKLGNPALEKLASELNDKKIDLILDWSLAVNKSVKEIVRNVPPFPFVKESLEKLNGKADAIVVSSTPLEALEREWEEQGIDKYVRLIAGQEFGSKNEHLQYAAKGKYDHNKILMIGDAPGDYNAAKANGVLFYPINPGDEEKSWENFYNEALDKFFTGSYAGNYEGELIKEFDQHLPEKPPWRTN